mmetsp:Transcript_118036/g.333865  ORF Transcript_118036/g.333865 Transcript_118036/m.333865 type:complete len:328 (-) Transcript_118036:3-986(-)
MREGPLRRLDMRLVDAAWRSLHGRSKDAGLEIVEKLPQRELIITRIVHIRRRESGVEVPEEALGITRATTAGSSKEPATGMIVHFRPQQRYGLAQHHPVVEFVPTTIRFNKLTLDLGPSEVVARVPEIVLTLLTRWPHVVAAVTILVVALPVAGAVTRSDDALARQLRQRAHEGPARLVYVHPNDRLHSRDIRNRRRGLVALRCGRAWPSEVGMKPKNVPETPRVTGHAGGARLTWQVCLERQVVQVVFRSMSFQGHARGPGRLGPGQALARRPRSRVWPPWLFNQNRHGHMGKQPRGLPGARRTHGRLARGMELRFRRGAGSKSTA